MAVGVGVTIQHDEAVPGGPEHEAVTFFLVAGGGSGFAEEALIGRGTGEAADVIDAPGGKK